MSNTTAAKTYLPLVPYELPYSKVATSTDSIHANQDALMIDGINRRNDNTAVLRSGSAMEAAANSRYGLALGNLLNVLTGFPEYLK